MDIKTLGVIGAGQMGNGIAQVAAMSGMDVIMSDISPEFVQKGLTTITRNLSRSVDKGKLSAAEKESILGRISTSTDLKDMAAADFVVEAATENEALKFKIFKDLDVSARRNRHPVHQYVVYPHRPDCVPDPKTGQDHRNAFHESRSGDAAGGNHSRPRHFR